MKKMHLSFIVVMFILLPLLLFADDTIQIQGNLMDVSGNPLVGANVLVQETMYGSSTDEMGYYNINLPDSEAGREVILEAGYMGYVTQSTKITLVSGTNTRHFQLEVDVLSLRPIVVSAQRREENLQKVPISIAVVDKTEIRNRGSENMHDFMYFVPGLQMATSENALIVDTSIRGVAGNATAAGLEARASYYVDDVYIGRTIAFNQDLLDLERVEILRGPQGTLFGKNTISGAIHLTTRKPHGRWEGTIGVEAGNFNYLNISAIVNAPLINEHLFAKLSGKFMKREGYVKNLYNSTDLNGWDVFNGRFQLRYLHSEALDIILSLDAFRDKRDPRTFVLALDGAGHDAAPGPREVSHNENEFGNRDNYGGALTIDYRSLNKYKLKSITGYRQNTYSSLTDLDGAPLDVMKSKDEEDDYHFTQELRLTSPSIKNFNFVGGLFYFYQKARKKLQIIGGPDFGVADFSVSCDGPVTTNSVAGYFNSNLRINDKIALNAGLRYTYEYKEINFSQKSLPAPKFTIDLDDYRDTYSEGVLSPKIGINYEFNNRLMFYGSIARGYKSGGWNSVFVSSTNYLKFKPEFATSYEIGLKSASINNRLIINAAVFLGKFSDYQVSYWQQTETGVINQVFQNAGKVTSKGIEIDLSTIPLKNLSLIARLAYTDIKYDEFKNGGGEGIDYDGNCVEIAPEFEYSLGIEYRYPIIQLGTFILRGDYVHKDDFFTDPSNEPDFIVPGYDLINGRIGYLSADENWGIYLWGKNLADKLYLLEKHFLPTGDPFGWYAIPRTYGIQVRYSIFK